MILPSEAFRVFAHYDHFMNRLDGAVATHEPSVERAVTLVRLWKKIVDNSRIPPTLIFNILARLCPEEFSSSLVFFTREFTPLSDFRQRALPRLGNTKNLRIGRIRHEIGLPYNYALEFRNVEPIAIDGPAELQSKLAFCALVFNIFCATKPISEIIEIANSIDPAAMKPGLFEYIKMTTYRKVHYLMNIKPFPFIVFLVPIISLHLFVWGNSLIPFIITLIQPYHVLCSQVFLIMGLFMLIFEQARRRAIELCGLVILK